MKTQLKIEDQNAFFILREPDPLLVKTILALEYQPYEDGFAKRFPAETPDLERIFANFERRIEYILLQANEQRPVPWEASLQRLLIQMEGRPPLDWFLRGSAALAVQGVRIHPHDIDLTTSAESAQALAALLLDDLVEPLQGALGGIADSFCRAFVHARVEWLGGVYENADLPEPGDFGPYAAARLESVHWREWEMRLPPVELQLAVSRRLGLRRRVIAIEEYLG